MEKLTNSKKYGPAYSTLYLLSFAHFINDVLQSVIPATYPLFKENYSLSYTQIGFIALSYQLTAALFQPLVGNITDKRPRPKLMIYGSLCSLIGIASLSFASFFLDFTIGVIDWSRFGNISS